MERLHFCTSLAHPTFFLPEPSRLSFHSREGKMNFCNNKHEKFRIAAPGTLFLKMKKKKTISFLFHFPPPASLISSPCIKAGACSFPGFFPSWTPEKAMMALSWQVLRWRPSGRCPASLMCSPENLAVLCFSHAISPYYHQHQHPES